MGTKTDRTSDDILPLEQVLVVRQDPETHQRESISMRWGLVPSWAQSPAIGNRLTHARAETVGTKRAFEEAFRHRRCLIVVDSFEVGRGRAIQMKDGRPFGVGGIWENWQRGDRRIESCSVITTEANDLVWPFNDRMPVIIAAGDYGPWLDPEFHAEEELRRMMQAFPPEEMRLTEKE